MKKSGWRVLLAVMLLCVLCTAAFAAEAETKYVAQVGDTKYETINAAIQAWTAGTTLTLLSDVTLSDEIQLHSDEHHILDLGGHIMTAASGQNAIKIIARGTGSSESNTLTIKADANNTGGINAGSKSIVYYDYSSGSATGADRPLIIIEGGTFTGSTSMTGAGFFSQGNEFTKCATFDIRGGIFNCSINGDVCSFLRISGGTFNYRVSSQGKAGCYRLISGGTFNRESLDSMTTDDGKAFAFGSWMNKYDVGVYIDDNGYLVVGGDVITSPTSQDKNFEASADYSNWSPYLEYSSAAANSLYYTSIEKALEDNNKASGKVTVYADEVDLTNIDFAGTLVLPEGKEVTIKGNVPNLSAAGTDKIVGSKQVNGETVYGAGRKTEYTVNHYQQKADGSGDYELVYSETLVGALGYDTAAVAKEYEGFREKEPVTQETIEEKDTVVKIYYNRLSYTLTFNPDNGDAPIEKPTLYGAAIVPPADPVRDKYAFIRWEPALAQTMPAEPVTYTAQWLFLHPDTQYTVQHHQQKADGSGYELAHSETLVGGKGYETEAAAKQYEGFEARAFHQQTIGDNTVVDIYYDRQSFMLTFDPDNGDAPIEKSTLYGAAIVPPEDPVRDKYAFVGWEPALAQTMPAQPVTYTAQWLSTDAGVSAVYVNGKPAERNGTEFRVVLPTGSELPTDPDTIFISLPANARISSPLQSTDNGSTWTFAVLAEDGVTEITYTLRVQVQPAIPATGDAGMPALWLALLSLSGVMLLALRRRTAR